MAVRGKPTVTPTVVAGLVLSAIRPWIPGYSGTRRYKAVRPGTDTKQPASQENPASGHIRRVWQVLGSNQRRLSRRFYRPTLPADGGYRWPAVRRPGRWAGPLSSATRRCARSQGRVMRGHGRRPPQSAGPLLHFLTLCCLGANWVSPSSQNCRTSVASNTGSLWPARRNSRGRRWALGRSEDPFGKNMVLNS